MLSKKTYATSRFTIDLEERSQLIREKVLKFVFGVKPSTCTCVFQVPCLDVVFSVAQSLGMTPEYDLLPGSFTALAHGF